MCVYKLTWALSCVEDACSKFISDFQQPSALDFFKLLITDEMLDLITEQTNIYAQQFIDTANLPPHSRVHGWGKEAHTRDKLKKFLAMIITIGWAW